MEKKWYIKIKGKRKGPYTTDQLMRHKEVTPDTLVWDEEKSVWVKLRKIPALQVIFKDPEDSKIQESGIERLNEEKEAGELVLQMRSDPPFFLYCLLLLLIILILIVLYR